MKILHITPAYKPAYSYGGPTESVARLCEVMARTGHQVSVFTTTANGKNELNIISGIPHDVDGVSVTYFKRITGDPTHISPALWFNLFKTYKEYDVIHLHSWWNPLVMVSAFLALFSKRKVVISPRGMLIFQTGKTTLKRIVHDIFGRRLLKHCVLHATSVQEFQECQRLIPDWKGFVLPNMVSLPAQNPLVRVEDKTFRLIFLSRIHPKKGLENLFCSLASFEVPFLLTIAGSGEPSYISELQRLAAKLKIDKKITWLGWVSRDEKFELLYQADLFVLLSLNENFANSVIESLFMGTAVLLSQYVGLAEFIQKENLGWISSLHTPDILQALDSAYMDSEKRHSIRKDSRAIIETTFDEKKIILAYLTNYL